MRTIRFRGYTKDLSKNKWIYCFLGNNNTINYRNEGFVFLTELTVDAESIGQFTRLYDIEGKEIYEGDIVVRKKDKEHSDKYIVDFKQGMFVMCNYDYGDISVIALNCYIESDISIRKYESDEDRINCTKVLLKVIGNIYESRK